MILSEDELTRLFRAEHWDPFSLLGPHPASREGTAGVVVRAFVPEASRVEVLRPGKDSQRMTRIHDEGLYEVTIADARLPLVYRLAVTDGQGHKTERHDPYAFSQLITDFDLHLFSEGRLYRAYNLLGAHCLSLDGIAGVRFIVWAPNAKRVSVVGDFNNWDGRRHQMRNRGVSGL